MGRTYLKLIAIAFTSGTGLIAAFGALKPTVDAQSREDPPAEEVELGAEKAPAESHSKKASFTIALEDLKHMRLQKGRYQTERADGTRITFTLDPRLQRTADSLFIKNKVPAGAAVVINSRTGRVLAFAQHRLVENVASTDDIALDSSPPAASLFKIVTAAALLEKSDVEVSTATCYRGGAGGLVLDNLRDFPREKSACATLETALGRSINAIFAKLSDRHLAPGILASYAKRFGFNEVIPFDIPVEASVADIPKDRLERARTAAGFWHTRLSPLHAAVIMQSLAQGGAMLRPYIVDTIHDKEGSLLREGKPHYLRNSVSKDTASSLIKAMTNTITRGTARHAFYDKRGAPFLPGVKIAGKTGTLNGKKPYRAFTWFAGVAPALRPEISVAVLVVNEPKWRIKAPFAAMQLFKEYFKSRPKNP